MSVPLYMNKINLAIGWTIRAHAASEVISSHANTLSNYTVGSESLRQQSDVSPSIILKHQKSSSLVLSSASAAIYYKSQSHISMHVQETGFPQLQE